MCDLVADSQSSIIFMVYQGSIEGTVLQPITTLKTFHPPFCETFISLILVSCKFLTWVGSKFFIYNKYVVISRDNLSLSKKMCS